jgi:starch phosphorylase
VLVRPLTSYGRDDGHRDLEHAVAELAERLPRSLEGLARLVFNYRWTWQRGGEALFRDMDAGLWKKSAGNPRFLIEAVPPHRLRALGDDPAYVARVTELAEALDAELARPAALAASPDRPIAYFCSEFGAHRSLPLYGGGLGVLAGDIVKSASDLALPLLGVGLLYREGYFHQRLDAAGWQHEFWIPTSFERYPAVRVRDAEGRPVAVELPLRGRSVKVLAWRIDFGRVPLYLLDTDCEENQPIDRWITARLYVGDRHTRLAQYAVLGVGGARMLAKMGIEPGILHLNEGHAALAAFERMAPLLAAGTSPDEALDRVRQGTVFTTHTPVSAGNEWYANEEIEPVLTGLRRALGIPAELFYGLGRLDPGRGDEPVAITPLALRTSRAANGVSRRHGEVARRMWQPLWPGRDASQVPITHVTNGVHTATWMADPMQSLLERNLGPEWRKRLGDEAFWARIADIPDADLWEVRRLLRSRLVDWAREKSVADRLGRGEGPDYVEGAARVFDPKHLTIGFARRVATYKRLHLLLARLDAGVRLLRDAARPIQLVVAGKAHPQDQEAKEALRSVLAVRPLPGVGSHIVFLEDYDLHQAPRIVAGVDLWLNLPRPPQEASGTSGMKVAVNGGLQLSVLDGWWDEAHEGAGGWSIASPDADPAAQDDHDAGVLFDLLDREVIPLFYERGEDGIPHRWLARVKASMAKLIPRFSAERMLRDYVEKLYRPTATARP